jgi:protease-4
MLRFKKRPTIAVLDVTGEIDESQALNILVVLRNTDWKGRNIRGVIVRICSNGGSLGAAQAICEGLDAIRDEVGLVTVSLATETALSAAFYVALGAEFSIASPAATVGNVGAIIGRINCFPLAEKLGISFQSVRSGVGKGALHPLANPEPLNEKLMTEIVSDISSQFSDWIRVRRKVSEDTLALISDGRMLSGKQAMEVGLLDSCGGLFSAIRMVSERIGVGETSLVWLNSQRPTLIGRILNGIKAIF